MVKHRFISLYSKIYAIKQAFVAKVDDFLFKVTRLFCLIQPPGIVLLFK